MSIEAHTLYALRNATVKPWPFPHFYAENVFPWDHYWQIITHLAGKSEYKLSKDYKNRSFATEMDLPGLDFLRTREFMNQVVSIFGNQAAKRLGGKENVEVYTDLRLVRDGKGYHIGPHTDAPWKLVSLLFYLPPQQNYHKYGDGRESDLSEFGTSIYLPNPRNVVCPGGPHYERQHFDKAWTAPYAPNTCFGFWKTDTAFHGVDPVEIDFHRDVLLYNIYLKEAFDASHQRPVPEEKPQE